MKSLIKYSFLAAVVSLVAVGSASADDQQLQQRLGRQQAQDGQPSRTTTVAVYANNRGVGRNATPDEQSDVRFELRSTAHGQVYGAYVSGR
ncbi:MAG: hypothetical protein ABJF10_14770 [Chthoniobacter sp.]|uniref:hypothetical protein n=1 Tax=Chthoniobacter sp. TaxID=2510640 RepID=UPI0032A544EC